MELPSWKVAATTAAIALIAVALAARSDWGQKNLGLNKPAGS